MEEGEINGSQLLHLKCRVPLTRSAERPRKFGAAGAVIGPASVAMVSLHLSGNLFDS